MTDLKFTSPSGETTIKLEGTGRLGTVAPKTQLHIKMDEPVQYETPMTENEEEIEKVKAQIKVLEKKLSFLEELEKQPKMTLANSGEFAVVSYNYKLYYRFEYPDSGNFSWYKTQDVPKGYVTGVFEPVTDAETERLLEGLYYNHIEVKKETAQESEENEWKLVALKLGENLSDNGPDGYYGFSADEWFEWVIDECLTNEVKRLQRKEWNAVRESVKWCEENPDKDPLDWLKPQTPEETEQGLKEAFREAVKQGVVSSSTKSKTLTDLIYDWWEDVFTTHSDWDMETSIANLVDRIELLLPKEQSAAGSQNAYVESAVEGFNDAIKKIKSKLR